VQDVDEELLRAGRSDPKVVMVECEVRQMNRWYDFDGEEVFPNVRLRRSMIWGFC
jgi:hypothetical protein